MRAKNVQVRAPVLDMASKDEVERQAGALPAIEAALSQSSTPPWLKRRRPAQSARTVG
jgi:hypothetical protein